MNYIKTPIIVKGINHSGTRAVVKILEILGSDPGKIDNEWKENTFFLELHKELIKKISTMDWTETIFNNDFLINGYDDNLKYLSFINRKLKKIINFYKNPHNEIWHWKCPSSAIFENTWANIYPNAYNIIIERDHRKIARSLMRDGLIDEYKEALKFCSLMNEKIHSVKNKNTLIIKYFNLKNEIENIADFIPIKVDEYQIKKAQSIVKSESILRFNKSLNYNLRNFYTEGKILLNNLKK